MTSHNIKKYPPPPIETAMGHMDKSRKNICSKTETQYAKPSAEYINNMNSHQEDKNNDIFISLGATDEKGTLYTYLTGKLPTASASGTKYILIAYGYDRNAIINKKLQGQSDKNVLTAHE